MYNELLDLLKKWRVRTIDAHNEEAAVRRFIERKIRDRLLKIIKKGALLLGEIPIDIEGRQYLIDIPNLCINIRDDENKYFWYMSYSMHGCYKRYEHYKNYSQQYRDLGLILNALDQYLDNKTNPEWNTVEKIEEAIQFVKDFEQKYTKNYLGFNNLIFVCVGDDFSVNKKRFINMSYDWFLKCMNLYKNVLLFDESNKSNDELNNLLNIFLNPSFRGNILNFLSNFELNKTLLLFELNKCLSTGSRYLEYEKLYERTVNTEQHHEYIMNVLKQINIDLYKKLRKEEMTKQVKIQPKNISLQQYDYKLHDLFYNPNFLRFLLPEEFNIDGSRFLVQIRSLTCTYYWQATVSIGDFFNIVFIPHGKDYFLSMSLSKFFANKYDKASIFEVYFPSVNFPSVKINENVQKKENLVKLIKKHKKLIMKYIFKETKRHVEKVKEDFIHLETKKHIEEENIYKQQDIEDYEEGERLIMKRIWMENEIDKIKGVQPNNSFYDIFLIDYAEQYFSDLKN